MAGFLDGFSIEVMPRTAEKIEDFRDLLPAGTRVYIAHIDGTPIEDMVEFAEENGLQAVVDLVRSLHLLGSHVIQCAHRLTGGGQFPGMVTRLRFQQRETKVQDLHLAIGSQHQIPVSAGQGVGSGLSIEGSDPDHRDRP